MNDSEKPEDSKQEIWDDAHTWLNESHPEMTRGCAGRSCSNRVPAPHLGSITFHIPQDFGVRVVLLGRRLLAESQFFRPSHSLDSLRLKRPAAYGPGHLRTGPSGDKRRTPHFTVPISPQCPQEIGLLTLPVFQGVAVSSERFSQLHPARNVAELVGSPLLRGSLE